MSKFKLLKSDLCSIRISTYFAFSIWLSSGLVLNHSLWAVSFDLSGFESVNALPDRIIPICLVYLVLPFLWLLSVVAIGLFLKYYRKRPLYLFAAFLITEFSFQLLTNQRIRAVIILESLFFLNAYSRGDVIFRV
jgi:hypothetical protein